MDIKLQDATASTVSSCAEKVKQILSKKMEEPKEQEMQMTLFQIGMGSGQCR